MIEQDVNRELPRYLDVLKWTGLGLTALGVAAIAYGNFAPPFSYDSEGIVDNTFVRGLGVVLGAGLGPIAVLTHSMQRKTEMNRLYGER